jgi:hypothetical protein
MRRSIGRLGMGWAMRVLGDTILIGNDDGGILMFYIV